ncbi:hypothetical protein [Sphingobacterium yanglingense]|uniref:Uncharacterized protein n=1 Tax=Sphingobacterium yanglingense TaxID=1437280 RepID=A0A4R6WLA3_9SPHI|nr:hypothetical protein [Sphingobacterium yanglingense]TDQ79558.1 hypothetical protein CLV99_1001 [Sphingobacterium yanglingense]
MKLDKVVSQKDLIIDSLSNSVISLQADINSLKASNKVIIDSLKSLDRILVQNEISTTYYSTHLATYTAIFVALITLLIAAITAINFFGMFKPINTKINELENTTLPGIIKTLEDEHAVAVGRLAEISKELKGTVNKSLIAIDRSMVLHHLSVGNIETSFIFCIRAVTKIVEFNLEETNKLTVFMRKLDSIQNDNNLKMSVFKSKNKNEIKKCLDKISKSNDHRYVEFAILLKQKLE